MMPVESDERSGIKGIPTQWSSCAISIQEEAIWKKIL
jgi:hypothetical protein